MVIRVRQGASGWAERKVAAWLTLTLVTLHGSLAEAQATGEAPPLQQVVPPAKKESDAARPVGRPSEGAPAGSDTDLSASDLTLAEMPVPPGRGGDAVRYVLEDVEIRGNTKTRRHVVERYVPFHRGDILDVDNPALTLTRYRLLGTGFFRDVQFSLRKGSQRGRVILVIEVTERNTIVLTDLAMGVSADADTKGEQRPLAAFMGVAAAERNLAGTGITLGSAMALSQGATTDSAIDQFALRVSFLDPAFLGSSWALSGELLYNDAIDFFGNSGVLTDPRPGEAPHAVLEYKRSGGQLGVGRYVSLSTQLWLTYRLETIGDVHMPRAAAHEYGGQIEPIDFNLLPGRSVLSFVRATLQHDTRDHPLLTSTGWLASASVDVSLSPAGSDYAYQRVDLSAQRWWPLPWGHTISLQFFGGAIAGDAPLFEQYYVGDFTDFQPGRLLGLNFDRRPAPNFLGTAIEEVRYAEYAAKINAEYRIPLYRGVRSVFGIDFFATFGTFVLAGQREIERPSPAYEGLERIPLDLTANLGVRIDTSLGGFTFSVSNVLGFLPALRGEDQ
jgi:outer membrane protein insertion porin family